MKVFENSLEIRQTTESEVWVHMVKATRGKPEVNLNLRWLFLEL